MPPNRFKSITMPIEAYEQAKQLKELGLAKSIPKAFANAMKEYSARREKIIEELLSVRTKHSELLQSANQTAEVE